MKPKQKTFQSIFILKKKAKAKKKRINQLLEPNMYSTAKQNRLYIRLPYKIVWLRYSPEKLVKFFLKFLHLKILKKQWERPFRTNHKHKGTYYFMFFSKNGFFFPQKYK